MRLASGPIGIRWSSCTSASRSSRLSRAKVRGFGPGSLYAYQPRWYAQIRVNRSTLRCTGIQSNEKSPSPMTAQIHGAACRAGSRLAGCRDQRPRRILSHASTWPVGREPAAPVSRHHAPIIVPMSGSPLTAPVESRQDRERRPPHLRIHAVNIFVRDQDLSLRFYMDQLGFDLAFDAVLQNGQRWVAVAPPDGSALLALIAAKPESREFNLIGRPTGVVFATEDVAAKYVEWMKRGVRFQYAPRLRRVKYASPSSIERLDSGAPSRAWGGVFTHFRDLDGNSFALVEFDEVTREIEQQRRAVAEKQDAERRAAQELEIAKQVQARLFPQTLPSIGTLEYGGACTQARQVGGDYYDFLELGQGRFALVTGDVAGKGIAAALLMSNLQANLRIQSQLSPECPRDLLRSVNQVFHRNTADSAYATFFLAEYEDAPRRLRYVNCGHLPALLLRNDDTVDRLESTGTVLGLFRNWDCEIGERALEPGDTLAVYTDGVTESFNDAEEEFGEERLIAALRRHRHLSPQQVIAAVVEEVRQFSPHEQHDDITLIVAKCR
jgi:serine phosphatase RsbU (regulator of sigma subunit)/catechol 2,3-dioxygenase-like lactoylglutathione lyase family enzyme